MSAKAYKILKTLETHGEKGSGIISLSLETGYSQEALREFFRKHNKYCTPLKGETTFALNQNTKEQGSIDDIVKSIERKQIREYTASSFTIGFCTGLIIMNADVLLGLLS